MSNPFTEDYIDSLIEVGYTKVEAEFLMPSLKASAKYFGRSLEEEVENFCSFIRIISK